jgi:hypothetical protein
LPPYMVVMLSTATSFQPTGSGYSSAMHKAHQLGHQPPFFSRKVVDLSACATYCMACSVCCSSAGPARASIVAAANTSVLHPIHV